MGHNTDRDGPGVAAEIGRMDVIDAAGRLPLAPWSSGRTTRHVRIRPEQVTGRGIARPAGVAPDAVG